MGSYTRTMGQDVYRLSCSLISHHILNWGRAALLGLELEGYNTPDSKCGKNISTWDKLS